MAKHENTKIKTSGVLGAINIAPDVIESIARIASEKGQAFTPLADYAGNIQSFFSKNSGVVLRTDDSGNLQLDVAVAAHCGTEIPKAAVALQKYIKEQIYFMTNIKVDQVNVLVCDLVTNKE